MTQEEFNQLIQSKEEVKVIIYTDSSSVVLSYSFDELVKSMEEKLKKDYELYLYEVSQFEKYGTKNIISFEDWLKIKYEK